MTNPTDMNCDCEFNRYGFPRKCTHCAFKWNGICCKHDKHQHACSKCGKMPRMVTEAIIYITDAQDGKEYIYLEKDFCEFIWTEGNAACDCNRGIYAGVWDSDDAFDGDGKCGNSRFWIRIEEDGKITYDEFEGGGYTGPNYSRGSE